MAQNTRPGIQEKVYRLAYLGGIVLFFLPFLEPFLPLMFTVAGSLVLGGLVKFIFGFLANRKINQTYKAHSSSNTRGSGASNNAGGSSGFSGANRSNAKAAGANIPPPRPEDPLESCRALLGLSGGFTRAQLKAAYRAMAAQYHPDRYASSPAQERQKAEEKMKKINEAYDRLIGTF